MQTFMVFFRENMPLRRLKLILRDEGYRNIRLDHDASSLVIDTDDESGELMTKLAHIIEDAMEQSGDVVVRSKSRLEQLVHQNPFQEETCHEHRIRYLLFQNSPSPDRMVRLSHALALDPNRIQFGPEGGYVCLPQDGDHLQRYIESIEEQLKTPTLARTHSAIERAITLAGEHEERLETEFYESHGL